MVFFGWRIPARIWQIWHPKGPTVFEKLPKKLTSLSASLCPRFLLPCVRSAHWAVGYLRRDLRRSFFLDPYFWPTSVLPDVRALRSRGRDISPPRVLPSERAVLGASPGRPEPQNGHGVKSHHAQFWRPGSIWTARSAPDRQHMYRATSSRPSRVSRVFFWTKKGGGLYFGFLGSGLAVLPPVRRSCPPHVCITCRWVNALQSGAAGSREACGHHFF